MESTDNTALNDQLKELHEKSNFAYNIEQTNISLDNMKKGSKISKTQMNLTQMLLAQTKPEN